MEDNTFFILMYSLGYILCYIMTKIVRNRYDDNEWTDVLLSILSSLSSYFGVIVITSIFLIGKNKTKPPKWL